MSLPDTFDVAAVFSEELDLAVAEEVRRSGFPVSEWQRAGVAEPAVTIEKWRDTDGPARAQAFIDWYEANPEAQVWVTPDGIDAIELPFEVTMGGIEVRGYIDLVLKIGTALVVVDVKTSAKQPENMRQLAIYASALEIKYGIRPRYGAIFMCRGVGRSEPKRYFMQPVELDKPRHSTAYLGREFIKAETIIAARAFPASPGDRCDRCGVAYACTEASGHRARELDPNWPGAKHG